MRVGADSTRVSIVQLCSSRLLCNLQHLCFPHGLLTNNVHSLSSYARLLLGGRCRTKFRFEIACHWCNMVKRFLNLCWRLHSPLLGLFQRLHHARQYLQTSLDLSMLCGHLLEGWWYLLESLLGLLARRYIHGDRGSYSTWLHTSPCD